MLHNTVGLSVHEQLMSYNQKTRECIVLFLYKTAEAIGRVFSSVTMWEISQLTHRDVMYNFFHELTLQAHVYDSKLSKCTGQQPNWGFVLKYTLAI